MLFSYSYMLAILTIFSGNRATLSKLCDDLVDGHKTREEILEDTEQAL